MDSCSANLASQHEKNVKVYLYADDMLVIKPYYCISHDHFPCHKSDDQLNNEVINSATDKDSLFSSSSSSSSSWFHFSDYSSAGGESDDCSNDNIDEDCISKNDEFPNIMLQSDDLKARPCAIMTPMIPNIVSMPSTTNSTPLMQYSGGSLLYYNIRGFFIILLYCAAHASLSELIYSLIYQFIATTTTYNSGKDTTMTIYIFLLVFSIIFLRLSGGVWDWLYYEPNASEDIHNSILNRLRRIRDWKQKNTYSDIRNVVSVVHSDEKDTNSSDDNDHKHATISIPKHIRNVVIFLQQCLLQIFNMDITSLRWFKRNRRLRSVLNLFVWYLCFVPTHLYITEQFVPKFANIKDIILDNLPSLQNSCKDHHHHRDQDNYTCNIQENDEQQSSIIAMRLMGLTDFVYPGPSETLVSDQTKLTNLSNHKNILQTSTIKCEDEDEDEESCMVLIWKEEVEEQDRNYLQQKLNILSYFAFMGEPSTELVSKEGFYVVHLVIFSISVGCLSHFGFPFFEDI